MSELALDQYSAVRPYARLEVSHWGHVIQDDCAERPGNLSSVGTSSQTTLTDPDPNDSRGKFEYRTHFLWTSCSHHPANLVQELCKTSASSVAAVASSSGSSRWHCRVCFKDPEDPTATICGHVFCHRLALKYYMSTKLSNLFASCIIEALRKDLQCPVCRKDLLVRLHV